tara:strand:+ start:23161 stop:23655 length:495 start_codon:yes stop_codon:yes gene_type:complete
MDKNQVVDFLPHRDPFLFIDSVSEVDTSGCESQTEFNEAKDLVGATVVANFEIKDDLEILKGHFPGNPILPGVVQVEMMAQASAFLSVPLVGTDMAEYEVETLLLSVDKAKFRKPLVPGMKLEIKAHLMKVRAGMASYEGLITCEGNKIAEAVIMASVKITKKD